MEEAVVYICAEIEICDPTNLQFTSLYVAVCNKYLIIVTVLEYILYRSQSQSLAAVQAHRSVANGQLLVYMIQLHWGKVS